MDLSSWPVEHASTALIDQEGSVVSAGETSRVYELASVTKLLSTYGFLVAIEEGVFDLDSAAGPEGSTVRHLLSHTSGIAFDSRDPVKPVGERRIYSSAGFEWLADIVEKEAEMPFAQYLREAVFEPLGMESTTLWGSAGHEARSTVDDLVKFAHELQAPTLLAPSSVREAMTPQFPDLRGIVPGYGMQKPCPWGLGFEIHGDKSPHWMGNLPEDAVGHFGMSGTYLWLVPSFSSDPAAGAAMIVLTDRDFGDWAKPLWEETNSEMYSWLTQG